MDFPAINMKAESGPKGVPTLFSTGPGIDIEQVFRLIIHHFQNVGMTADEHVGPILTDQFPRLGIIMPRRSVMITSVNPADSRIFVMAMAAAPAPEVTIRTSSFFFPTTFSALVRPASVMTAVPC